MQELSCFPVAFPAHPVLLGRRAPLPRPVVRSFPGKELHTQQSLVGKEWTLFPNMLACYPKQTASTVGSTFLW